jgi:hypothetical protein
MPHTRLDAPHPDLRIVPTAHLHPHEEHDSQRSSPLVERLRRETYMINPPLVANMGAQYVILDGANRFQAFVELGYPHMLVQVVDYSSGWVQVDTWHHVIGGWQLGALLDGIAELAGLHVSEGQHDSAIARLTLVTGAWHSVWSEDVSANTAVRRLVSLYQQHAVLHRTAIHDDEQLWDLYPDAIGLVRFPAISHEVIIQAARTGDYLPPGVSRHIVQGRAIRVNYPLDTLRDPNTPLEEKNAALREWVRHKLAARQVRYYAEATYQFDE